jgi:hypothetical protein
VNRLDFYDIQPKPFIREGQNRARCYARLSGGEAAEESERDIIHAAGREENRTKRGGDRTASQSLPLHWVELLTAEEPLMDDKDKLDQIGRAMMAAWQRVKKAPTRMWGDWMIIGDGLLEGRRWAMQMAGTNAPEGKGYVTAFGEWLKRYRVDDMDKSDRAKLLQLMEERPAVEEWRSTLTDYERRSLNHPVIVWRKWTAATRVKKPKPRTAAVSASEHGRAQAMIAQLQEEELAAARERIAELEAPK